MSPGRASAGRKHNSRRVVRKHIKRLLSLNLESILKAQLKAKILRNEKPLCLLPFNESLQPYRVKGILVQTNIDLIIEHPNRE